MAEQLVIDWSVQHQVVQKAVAAAVSVAVKRDGIVNDTHHRVQHQMEPAPFIPSDDDLPGIFFEDQGETQ